MSQNSNNIATTAEPPLDVQENYWEWWQETRSINSWSQRRADEILGVLNSLSIERPKILDFGCGSGWFTEKLSGYGEATGIDLSKKAMSAAQAQFPHINFIGGDVFSYDLPRKYFDIVVSQQVIPHVQDQQGYLERAADVLKPNGYLIITCNNKFVLDRLKDKTDFTHTEKGHMENWLDSKGLKTLLQPGFRVISERTIIPMGNRGILRIINSEKLDHILCAIFTENRVRTLKERMGLGYIIIMLAQKR
jgi:SAM-dependent methyltransferase